MEENFNSIFFNCYPIVIIAFLYNSIIFHNLMKKIFFFDLFTSDDKVFRNANKILKKC